MKKKAKNVTFWSKKDASKVLKYITPMDFAEHFRKLDLSENRKLYYGWFLRNGLKSRWDVQYLEVS